MISEITQNGRIVQIRAKTLDVNAYLILQSEYTIIIDSLLLPRDSQELQKIAESYHKPVKYLINTHFHSDHCLGNRFLKQPDTIQVNQARYWETIVNEKAMINPKRQKQLDQSRLTKPEITFDTEYNIDDLVLFSTPGHSADSICIYLPQEKALIAGDTILSNTSAKYSLPYFFWGSPTNLINSLQKLLKLNIATIYSGHGFPLPGTDKIESDLIYLQNLCEQVQKYSAQSLTSQELAEKITISDCLNSAQPAAVPQVHELNIRQLSHLPIIF